MTVSLLIKCLLKLSVFKWLLSKRKMYDSILIAWRAVKWHKISHL